MGSSESTKRLTVERPGEDETPGIVKVSDDFNVILKAVRSNITCSNSADHIFISECFELVMLTC